MAISKEVLDEIKALRKERNVLAKRVKALKLEGSLAEDMSGWQKITDTKKACLKLIADANLSVKLPLTILAKFPDYYIYQHPIMKKLKTSNRNIDWVQHYIGEKISPEGGASGTEEELLETAKKSQLALWIRLTKKKKKKKLPSTIGNMKKMPGSGKTKAVGKVGVG